MKKIIYGVLAAIALSGCEKKLDLVNPNYPTTASFWKTSDQAFAAVNSVYNSLTLDGTYNRSFPGLQDSRGEDVKGDSPWGDLVATGQFVIPNTSDPVLWIWRDFYLTIGRANRVIANVEAYKPEDLDDAAKKRIMGQAYFLRALSYFNLINNFEKIPLITTPPASKQDYYPATAKSEDVWNQIFEDLKTAEDYLPLDYSNVVGPDKGQVGRATKGAAAGLLGKAYVYQKKWDLAQKQFEKFVLPGGIFNGRYSLTSNYRDNFSNVGENNAESLFEIQFDSSFGSDGNWTGEPNANWRQFAGYCVTYAPRGFSANGVQYGGYKDYIPTAYLRNQYKTETTVDGGTDPRLLATVCSYEPAANSTKVYGVEWPYGTNEMFLRKYTHDGLNYTGPETFENGDINYRVLRYADILMLYAETLNELGRTADAYTYIQQVRSRAKLKDLATVKPGMNKDQMKDQIAHERLLEFAVEGQRIHDLIRWGWFYDNTKLAALKAADSDFNTWKPGKEYLPVPLFELNANKNLVPNSAN
ncbi:hypothetical protein BCY91_04555 [Pelobium manganitolerans]|uniref:Carbohydrate-binding protein SusD n=1 Tax=Pelobium manganitolerans TaxID=1842495 RepID=A0A419S5M4_9SPHI|nr:RagB/SusD family nutrient uptake outer membrane protein [Pelobium manganitolerans]RKD16158.1 hypothetical protein BCY91_04555 [Pelobium manganitolerans]